MKKFVVKLVHIGVIEKTAGLRSGNFLNQNSACSKVLVSVKIFQFQDMENESEWYRDAANYLYSAQHFKCN
jgi:hypothetical protein